MEKETGSSNREEPFEIDWGAHEREPVPEETVEEDDLPVEPTPPWEDEDESYDGDAALSALLDFFLYGRRGPHAVPDAGAEQPIPALLYPYRDLKAIRYDYPICLPASTEKPVRPLKAVIDDIVARVVEDGDVGERRAKHIQQLEIAMRGIVDAAGSARLSAAWDEAANALIDDATTGEKKDLLRQSFGAAREALALDGELLPCAPTTPMRVFQAVVAANWQRKCAVWRDALDSLVARAQAFLSADASHTADMQNPQHLRDAAAGEDMDFEKMSSLLKQSHIGEPLPAERRSRIQRVLDTITRVKPLFDGTASLLDSSAKLPFDLQPVRNVCKAALDRHHERMKTMVDFFKAIRVAELEVQNRYRESKHDRFFAQFDATHLTAEELSFCPPVVLVLDHEFFESPDVAGLFDLLGSGAPVKVFAEVGDVAGAGDVKAPWSTPSWSARLGNMIAALNDVYVVQAPASLPSLIHRGASDGFDYDGPSVVIVYTGNDVEPGTPMYLATATALESRVFPAFRFDPGAGATVADRTSVSENPHATVTFPPDVFTYKTLDGERHSAQIEFTPADFFYGDVRFENHFWCVDPAKWHENMVPLHEYACLDEADLGEKVPYITAVDAGGSVMRVVVTHHVVDLVQRVAKSWHNLRESGGIENSFVANAIEDEKRKLEETRQEEIDAIEKKYAANLERDLGDLTQEIVQRIAARLISESGAAAPLAMPVTPAAPVAPAPAPAEAAPEAPAEAEEADDEIVVSDDPYVDTPLCTSCNECTKINSQIFEYDGNKQAFIKNASAGPFKDLVAAAEKCPVKIIHPGKPKDPSEPGLDDLIKRAEKFN